MYDELSERVLMRGDSSQNAENFEGFLARLKKVIACDEPYTVVLDDPLANSYIQNPYAPDVDEQLTDEKYTRSWDQNEDLGLNDINVDNYSTDPELQQQQPQQQQPSSSSNTVQSHSLVWVSICVHDSTTMKNLQSLPYAFLTLEVGLWTGAGFVFAACICPPWWQR